MPKKCWFCSDYDSGQQRPTGGPLCDRCRALLSDFLVWMGRRPLPQREKIER
jgi:hypothetical protein